MQNFRTYELSLDFYKKCQLLKLRAPLRNQFERACLSIPLNLAEGSAKPTARDRRKFYRIALGSLREVQCILTIAEKKHLIKSADVLGAHLYKLCLCT